MKYWMTFFLLLGLSACASAPTPLPDPQSEAAKLYAARCGGCHSIPHPARLGSAQWQHMLTLMERRMLERKMPPLNDTERATLLGYLTAHARR